ncbi:MULTISPECIES: hypothetical protein [unclassified Sphingobium]|uniref:hypothetical protein n=1 Tax=unclassified Sphingobium TaxID=2611147 RepID=UPI002225405A|nr:MULTISPECIES: hypothetical protein [unclassified Sphingobium]MCW2393744.1 hypothetical protein [Sphingobium sp. B8D3B]MCW2417257.1 hypothetical protein [Sphingobium sp. B8D3C]
MSGSYSIYDFQDAMDCIIQTLRLNGVRELRSVNIYLRPHDGDKELSFTDQETGAPFNILKYGGRKEREFRVISPRFGPAHEDEDSGIK